MATGKTLGELARAHFGPWARACIGVLIVTLVVANTLNIAADLVAIGSGMALLHAGPSWLWALIAGAGITALILPVMFAIITATASTLGLHKGTDITSTAQAAGALKPVAGSLASTLFALGFIGPGMLAVPVLAGAGSVGLAGLLGRPWGLSLAPRKAPLFYVLLGAGTVGGTALTLAPVNPISLLVLVAVVNGIAAAPFLIVVMIISRNRPLMGENRNGDLAAVLGWATVALMTAAAVAVLVSLTGA